MTYENMYTLFSFQYPIEKIPDLFPLEWEGEWDRDRWPRCGVPSYSHPRIRKDEREKRREIEEDEWKMEEDDRLNREPDKRMGK